MSQKTDAQLTTQAQTIRDETTALANTKSRVYTSLKDAIDSKINNDKIIDEDNMASNSATNVPTQQSVKAYVDDEIANASLSIVTSWKNPVRAASTVNGTLATAFENGDVMDGVTLATGDRILLKNQTNQTENGIRIVAASGAPSRSADTNTGPELEGAGVTVQEGTINANTTWLQTTDSVTIDVSNIVWTQLGTNVPPADGTTPGIAKLYNNVSGTNTDGPADQNSVKVALDLKLAITNRMLGISFSDQVTPITTGTSKMTFHFPYTTTIQEIWMELSTAQSSGSIFTVDVNVAASTILSTKLTIDNTEETSLTAAIPPVISSASITQGDKVTIDVDQVGNGTALGGKIWFRG